MRESLKKIWYYSSKIVWFLCLILKMLIVGCFSKSNSKKLKIYKKVLEMSEKHPLGFKS